LCRDLSMLRGRARLMSGVVLLVFVLSHLAAHSFLLISFDRATAALGVLMYFWRTEIGTVLLSLAILTHCVNALWSIYVRRSLHLVRWEWWQLGLGLCIPLLLMLHVTSTRVAEELLGVKSSYSSVLTVQWQISPWLGLLQVVAVLTVWLHACIGLHFWLRIKPWYPRWRALVVGIGVLPPTVALCGYISAGNQLLREANGANHAKSVLEASNLTEQKGAEITRIARIESVAYLVLIAAPLLGRGLRTWLHRRRKLPLLRYSNGHGMSVLPGATVLETLRDNGISHASVCGGRARCTTCRVFVTTGLDTLPAPSELEARALARIGATSGIRLACQIRPTADVSVIPLLSIGSGPFDSKVRGELEGLERPITVLFVDLRGSTALGEAKMPYDFLHILNQFLQEMTKALDATNGHYAQFTGDGLMALYGLNTKEPATGIVDALHGAREMLARIDRLNGRLRGDLPHPLRIGIGIHFSEAVVGAMGPPTARIIFAIGEMVSTCARLEGLTKKYNCRVTISRHAVEAAGLDFKDHELHRASVSGLSRPIEFYAVDSLADLQV
jgi:adenylate cyclase